MGVGWKREREVGEERPIDDRKILDQRSIESYRGTRATRKEGSRA